MSLAEIARSLAKLPLKALLTRGEILRRIVFEIKQNHYADLDIAIPLGFDLSCPVTSVDHWYSFAEIFVQRVYDGVFDQIALPNRWVDLGCHAGYFSLLIAWLRVKQGLTPNFKSLLVDADPRVLAAVHRLIGLNHLENNLSFRHGAIAQLPGEQAFAMKSVMSSSLVDAELADGKVTYVQTVTEDDLLSLMPPPLDLIKVDIEGMEYELLTNYRRFLEGGKYLLIEWHSWHKGGGGANQIVQLAGEQGFKLIKETEAAHPVEMNGQSHQCGVFLFGK
jgi:FkbM family methyltransferase